MKELSIEQKAIAYDAAVKEASIAYKDEDRHLKATLERIFPKLKESEDEKIRKAILNYLKKMWGNCKDNVCGIHVEDAITWLEKQGGNLQFWRPTKEQYEALDYAYNSCPDTERGNYYEGVLETLIDDLHRLEKQGEKPQGKSALEAAKEEEVDNQNCVKPAEPKDYSSIDPYFFKTMDKPRFHEGDFIVDTYCRGKIIALTADAYLLDTGQGIPFSCEHNAHLWTIQDAKDGDVLFMDNGAANCVFIYKSFNNGIINKYASYNNFGFEGEHYLVLNNGYIIPATKEQCDALFTKMKEKGYEWDAEKKELKIIDWSKHIKYNPNNPSITGENPTWSEEDEKRLNSCLNILRPKTLVGNTETTNTKWLKSLKERIGG